MVLMLGGMATLAACGADRDPVVISVGSETVLRSQFEQAFWTAMERDSTLGPDQAGIDTFARDHARNLLIQLLAQESQPELEEGRQERLEEYREQLVVERLRSVEFGDAYTAKPQDLQAAYEKLSTRRKLRQIVFPTEADARETRRAILEGAAFAKVAQQRSLDDRTRDSGGELGWLIYTEVPPDHRDIVFSLAAGEITQPLSRGDQSVLYQVEEVTENHARGTLEAERAELERGIIVRQITSARKAYHQRLLDRYHFKPNPAEIAWLTVHMKNKTARATRGTAVLDEGTTRDGVVYTEGRIPWEGPPLAVADTGRVVATFDPPDGRVLPIWVFDQLLAKPVPTWPTFDTTADVEELIQALVLERLEIREARARGYESLPEIQYQVKLREDDIRRRQFIRNAIRDPLRPTEDEVRAEYDRRLAEFSVPETRRFVAINLSSLEAARRAAAMLAEGKSVADIQSSFAPGDSVRATGEAGTPPMTKGQSPLLDDVLFALPLGGVSSPVAVGTSFTVAKVIEIVPPVVKPFEEVKVAIQVGIVDEREKVRLDEMIAEAEKRWPVTIHSDALKDVRPTRPALDK